MNRQDKTLNQVAKGGVSERSYVGRKLGSEGQKKLT